MATTTRPLTGIVDDVLETLAVEGFVTSPGIHPDQSSAREQRTDQDAPLIGYLDADADETTMSLFHDLPATAHSIRVLEALEAAGLNVDWPDRDPDLRIDVALPA
ncbi:hypothetical protein DVS28_b0047 (plasmid) [Euzebya pacifica]|uniref:Uncharacterized protein n=1 Tax=Euzebya pacifica TaxID=1608957 RepID=A0A346Y5S0_9ACTN|nr:hypothetical protein [Euzebya pacifica]AXV09817.1 hypothetical protein DVS28_b0047 [Euzebya pacifica]